MDLLYSYSLLMSLVSGGLGCMIGGLAVFGRDSSPHLVRLGLSATAVAALSLATSIVVHWHWGHGPAGTEPMGFARFAGSHTGFLAASVVVVVGCVLLLHARRRADAD